MGPAGSAGVRWRATGAKWLIARGNYLGHDNPSFGVAVWHVWVPTATNYTLRVGACNCG